MQIRSHKALPSSSTGHLEWNPHSIPWMFSLSQRDLSPLRRWYAYSWPPLSLGLPPVMLMIISWHLLSFRCQLWATSSERPLWALHTLNRLSVLLPFKFFARYSSLLLLFVYHQSPPGQCELRRSYNLLLSHSLLHPRWSELCSTKKWVNEKNSTHAPVTRMSWQARLLCNYLQKQKGLLHYNLSLDGHRIKSIGNSGK